MSLYYIISSGNCLFCFVSCLSHIHGATDQHPVSISHPFLPLSSCIPSSVLYIQQYICINMSSYKSSFRRLSLSQSSYFLYIIIYILLLSIYFLCLLKCLFEWESVWQDSCSSSTVSKGKFDAHPARIQRTSRRLE